MKNLKFLIKDKYYRRVKMELLKIKFTTLPGIHHIILRYKMHKLKNKMHGKNKREQYIIMKNDDSKTQLYCFAMALIKLKIAIMNNDINEEKFYKAKNDILSNYIINEPKIKEFRDWVEKIDHNETDCTRIQDILNSLIMTR